MNRLAAIATASALFCAGLFLGLAVRRRAPEPGRHPSSETMRRNPAPPRLEGPTPAPELPKLEARVRELEAELSTLRSGRAKPGSEPAPAAFAEEIFKGYLELHQSKNPDPEKARTFLARLGQLDEKSAGYFIEQFRKSKGPDSEDEREVAMELALACGGPAVADFVNLLLNDPSVGGDLRGDLLQELSGAGGGLFSIRRLPISDALASTAMTLCRSASSQDRQGAAGLLGGLKSEASRAELRRLVEEDTDLSVRTSAILSLGHVGDRSSQTYLEGLCTAPETSKMSGQGVAKFRSAIESALKELGER